jgi:hypothetical protein
VLGIREPPQATVDALLAADREAATPEQVWSEAAGPVTAWVVELMARDGWGWDYDDRSFWRSGEAEIDLDDAVMHVASGA